MDRILPFSSTTGGIPSAILASVFNAVVLCALAFSATVGVVLALDVLA